MKQKGTVIKTEGEKALVAIPRASACGEHCASCAGGCQSRGHNVWLSNPISAKAGDLVSIQAADSAVLLGAFLVYGLPLIIFFLAYGISFSLLKSQTVATTVSLLSLLVSFFLLRLVDQHLAPKPVITEILTVNHSGKDESHGI